MAARRPPTEADAANSGRRDARRLTLERPRAPAGPRPRPLSSLISRKHFRLYDPLSDRIFMGPGPPARLECRFFAIPRGVTSLFHPLRRGLYIFNGTGARVSLSK